MWTKSSKEITVNEQIVFQFTRIFSKLCFTSSQHKSAQDSTRTILETCDIWDTYYNSDHFEPEFMTIFVSDKTKSTDSGFRISLTHGKTKNGGSWSMTSSMRIPHPKQQPPFLEPFPYNLKRQQSALVEMLPLLSWQLSLLLVLWHFSFRQRG